MASFEVSETLRPHFITLSKAEKFYACVTDQKKNVAVRIGYFSDDNDQNRLQPTRETAMLYKPEWEALLTKKTEIEKNFNKMLDSEIRCRLSSDDLEPSQYVYLGNPDHPNMVEIRRSRPSNDGSAIRIKTNSGLMLTFEQWRTLTAHEREISSQLEFYEKLHQSTSYFVIDSPTTQLLNVTNVTGSIYECPDLTEITDRFHHQTQNPFVASSCISLCQGTACDNSAFYCCKTRLYGAYNETRMFMASFSIFECSEENQNQYKVHGMIVETVRMVLSIDDSSVVVHEVLRKDLCKMSKTQIFALRVRLLQMELTPDRLADYQALSLRITDLPAAYCQNEVLKRVLDHSYQQAIEANSTDGGLIGLVGMSRDQVPERPIFIHKFLIEPLEPFWFLIQHNETAMLTFGEHATYEVLWCVREYLYTGALKVCDKLSQMGKEEDKILFVFDITIYIDTMGISDRRLCWHLHNILWQMLLIRHPQTISTKLYSDVIRLTFNDHGLGLPVSLGGAVFWFYKELSYSRQIVESDPGNSLAVIKISE